MKNKDLTFAILASDVVIFCLDGEEIKTLLINVNRPPHYVNVKAFPGGLIAPSETAEESVERHVKEKGGIDGSLNYIEQIYTFSEIDRDPRGRVVSVGYLGLIKHIPSLHNSAFSPEWHSIDCLPKLAYDHGEIFKVAIERLRSKLEYTNIISFLMPTTFTLSSLQAVYEKILGRSLDKRNFRKKIKSTSAIIGTGQFVNDGAHRPAELFKFKHKKITSIDLI